MQTCKTVHNKNGSALLLTLLVVNDFSGDWFFVSDLENLHGGRDHTFIFFGVEFSQLTQTPVMDPLRETLYGKLVLGSGFRGSDFVCYALGCFIGVIGEGLATKIQGVKPQG